MRRHVLILICALLMTTGIAIAQDVGIFVRPGTNSIGSPIADKTWLADTTDDNLKVSKGGSSWDTRTPPHFNLAGGGNPTAFNDNTQGYAPGSVWYDGVGKQIYVCTDATTSSAVWSQYSGGISSLNFSQKFTTGDWINDFVATGLVGSVPGSGFTMTTPGGVAYVSGLRITPSSFSFTYSASKDTYDWLQPNGSVNHPSVVNNAPAPTGQTGLFIQKVVTNGSTITSVTQTQATTPSVNVRTPEFTLLDSTGLNAYTVAVDTPSAFRTVHMPDVGGTSKFALQNPSGVFHAGGLCYGNGAMLDTTAAGTIGQLAVSQGTSAPSFQTLGGTGGIAVTSTGGAITIDGSGISGGGAYFPAVTDATEYNIMHWGPSYSDGGTMKGFPCNITASIDSISSGPVALAAHLFDTVQTSGSTTSDCAFTINTEGDHAFVSQGARYLYSALVRFGDPDPVGTGIAWVALTDTNGSGFFAASDPSSQNVSGFIYNSSNGPNWWSYTADGAGNSETHDTHVAYADASTMKFDQDAKSSGSQIDFYINGALVATNTTHLPGADSPMFPYIGFYETDTTVDYVNLGPVWIVY